MLKALEIILYMVLALIVAGGLLGLSVIIYIQWQSFMGKNPFM